MSQAFIQSITVMYCPAHKGIRENETPDNIAETTSKKASHLP